MAAQPPVWDPFDNPFYGPIHPLTPPIRPYVYPAPRPKPHWLRALEKRVNSNPFIAIPYWLSVWDLSFRGVCSKLYSEAYTSVARWYSRLVSARAVSSPRWQWMWLLPLFLSACSRATGDSIARTIVEQFGNSLVTMLIGAILALIVIAILVNSLMQMLGAWDGESNIMRNIVLKVFMMLVAAFIAAITPYGLVEIVNLLRTAMPNNALQPLPDLSIVRSGGGR